MPVVRSKQKLSQESRKKSKFSCPTPGQEMLMQSFLFWLLQLIRGKEDFAGQKVSQK